MQPLLTSITLTEAHRLERTVLDAIADREIKPDEQRAIVRALSDLEGAARHADNRQRYTAALNRGTGDVIYLDTLAARAGLDPLEAA